jgi:hypothetical protein
MIFLVDCDTWADDKISAGPCLFQRVGAHYVLDWKDIPEVEVVDGKPWVGKLIKKESKLKKVTTKVGNAIASGAKTAAKKTKEEEEERENGWISGDKGRRRG